MRNEYTNKLHEMIEEGRLDKDMVIMACVKYMQEDHVESMMKANEMVPFEAVDDDYSPEEDGPDWGKAWYDTSLELI